MNNMTLGRTDEGLTIAVNRILAGGHLARLNEAGVPTKRAEALSDEYLYKRATNDYDEKADQMLAKDPKANIDHLMAAQARGEEASSSLDYKPEMVEEAFGFDRKVFQARSGEILAAQKRHTESIQELRKGVRDWQLKRPDWVMHVNMTGLDSRQRAVVRRAQQQFVQQERAMDPATDTGLIGTDYMHEPMRELLSVEDLMGLFIPITIPGGYRSFVASNLADGRILKTAATTSDAYGFNTAEDPTSGSTTWTPVKLMGIIPWNGEFEDDSLFGAEQALRQSMQRGLLLALFQAILFGDTTNSAGANINASGGSLALGTKDPRLCWNGIAGDFYRGTHGGKSADTFTGGINGGGDAMTVTDVYDMLKDCGKFALPQQASNLHLACSAQSYWNVRTDALTKYQWDILNKDVFGLNWNVSGNGAPTHAATSNVPTDALNLWDGVPTNRNASGVFDNVTATKAIAVLWNALNYGLAVKRVASVKVVNIDPVDLKAICLTMRLDFKPIIANLAASTVGYNIL